ncbi:hypothetical protein PMAYCL1PPCAC_22628, partial [Pristionchus mayeri]
INIVAEIPYDYFLSLNPTLNCDRMNMSDQVCIGRGPYEASRCLDSFRVMGAKETCSSLLSKLRISQQQLDSFNPNLNCSGTLPQYSMVCTSAMETEDRLTIADRLFQALRTVSPGLFEAFEQYKSQPTQTNTARVYNTLVARILEDLSLNNSQVRLFMDSGLKSKAEMCDNLRDTEISNGTITCFCESARLNAYCHAMLYQELDSDEGTVEDERSMRKKLSMCEVSGNLPLNIDDYFSDKNAQLSGCFGGSCAAALGFVEISLSADICMPYISVNDGKLKFCLSSSECEQGDLSAKAYVSRLTSSVTASAGIDFCLVGSTFMERAAKIILRMRNN